MDSKPVLDYLSNLQQRFCQKLAAFEQGSSFKSDHWHKAETETLQGHGQSNVLEFGQVIDKGGVNFSHVWGNQFPASATQTRTDLVGLPFEALGLSIVIHPKNPMIPCSHANLRLLISTDKAHKPVWWFGGGFDLTPYYPFQEDVILWHKAAKTACQPFGQSIYPSFKKWCDEYFYLPHRHECRGVGGLFFDDLNQANHGWSFEKCFSFIQSVGETYLESYMTIVEKRHRLEYTDAQKKFQQYRRGRYVEFNLLYDRGTLFGLQSNGRTESILMSLPNEVHWQYNWQPEPMSEEAKLNDFLKPQDWV